MTQEQAARPQRPGHDPMTRDERHEPDARSREADAGAPAAQGGPRAEAGAEAATEQRTTTQAGANARPEIGAGAPDRPGDAGEAEQRIAELEARCAALEDKYLRAVAEIENVRRRGQEEVARTHKFAIEAFAESLLPVHDSLELALKSEAPSVENMREGVEATLRLFGSAFEKHRLMQIDPAGQKFDPNLHQAISMVPGKSVDPPVPPNHVVTVLQKGYLINDRVLRPALVTVAEG